ncbi:uncharacterized protein F5Z01DRAFT_299656 [Emericellopsis atlantica]|uniref:Uncharacterized protein n=1 Tax=Emericellopsis atlantica TaxID=2614577 RepID=A0A9P7ZGM5_9HYPO|nr:uncharacterized protein F5Z01DRAFT_299656 [Emericellopsis atlantica]KAG9251210.1 hypothetical protein F5Z01DRAFT_299656 [Emericellopsis atlantica]
MLNAGSVSDYPFCVTGFLTSGTDTLTAFRCGRGELSGEASLYLSPDITSTLTRTTTVTTEEDDKIKTVTKVITENTATATPNDENSVDGGDASNPGSDGDTSNKDKGGSDSNNDASKDNNGGNSGGGGSTPIGAIVGGTIGGVALLLLIAFAIWFIRFQKKKSAGSAAESTPGMEPYRQSEYAGDQPGYAGSPPQGYQSGYYAPSTQSYEPQGYAGAPAGYASTTTGSSPPPGQPMMTQMAPVEMPGYSGYGVPQELPSHGR